MRIRQLTALTVMVLSCTQSTNVLDQTPASAGGAGASMAGNAGVAGSAAGTSGFAGSAGGCVGCTDAGQDSSQVEAATDGAGGAGGAGGDGGAEAGAGGTSGASGSAGTGPNCNLPLFYDCDGNAANGCEADIQSDVDNCGACGAACPDDHGEPGCFAMVCVMVGCDIGFGDCNGTVTDGCETDVTSNPQHCGMCGKSCSAGQTCTQGVCN